LLSYNYYTHALCILDLSVTDLNVKPSAYSVSSKSAKQAWRYCAFSDFQDGRRFVRHIMEQPQSVLDGLYHAKLGWTCRSSFENRKIWIFWNESTEIANKTANINIKYNRTRSYLRKFRGAVLKWLTIWKERIWEEIAMFKATDTWINKRA